MEKKHYGMVEFHISADPAFTVKFGKRVKALGGTYSHVHGDRDRRFVTLPVVQESLKERDEKVTLARDFIAEFGCTVAIPRPLGNDKMPHWRLRKGERKAPSELWESMAAIFNAVAIESGKFLAVKAALEAEWEAGKMERLTEEKKRLTKRMAEIDKEIEAEIDKMARESKEDAA